MSQRVDAQTREKYEVVIGLEVHVQLLTETKIFSAAPASYGAAPNTQVSAVDLGLPGVLPVLNRRAVEFAMRAGFALNCEVRGWSRFARKNYFYPDMPRGYQITQFEHPICEHGHLEIRVDEPGKPPGEASVWRTIGITRIHLEEDAGKSTHVEGAPYSLVDLNRAGVALIEIVSEPDLRGAEEAVAYLKELRNIVLYLGICDGNMQEGSFRCDANVSVRLRGDEKLGTRSELKNINSFKFIHDAIEYEVDRQIALIEAGGKVTQETRLYNPDRGETFAMRGKEESQDYRYFPEPDLPPLVIDPAWMQAVREALPELPAARRRRYQQAYGLSTYDAVVLSDEQALGDYFDEALAALGVTPQPPAGAANTTPGTVKTLVNWVLNELLARLDAHTTLATTRVRPQGLAALVGMIEAGEISGKIAKQVFDEMFETGEAPQKIVAAKGLVQISDRGVLGEVIAKIMAENAAQVAKYRGGNTNLLGWFVGQVMRATRGQANPQVVNELLEEMLSQQEQG